MIKRDGSCQNLWMVENTYSKKIANISATSIRPNWHLSKTLALLVEVAMLVGDILMLLLLLGVRPMSNAHVMNVESAILTYA